MKDGPKGLRARRVCARVCGLGGWGGIVKCLTIEEHPTDTTPLISPIWRLNPHSYITPCPPQGTLTPSTPNTPSSTTHDALHPHPVGRLWDKKREVALLQLGHRAGPDHRACDHVRGAEGGRRVVSLVSPPCVMTAMLPSLTPLPLEPGLPRGIDGALKNHPHRKRFCQQGP